MSLKTMVQSLLSGRLPRHASKQLQPASSTAAAPSLEPSLSLRKALRRHALGLSPYKQSCANGLVDWPLRYTALPIYNRVNARSSWLHEAQLFATRFTLTETDENMARWVGRQCDGVDPLQLDLAGLELSWHRDLLRALEEVSPMWSASRVQQNSGSYTLEHLIIPSRGDNGSLLLLGWLNWVGGTISTNQTWRDVEKVSRLQRCQRISINLPPAATAKSAEAQ